MSWAEKQWYSGTLAKLVRDTTREQIRDRAEIAYAVPVDCGSFVPGEATSSTISAVDVSNPPRLSHPVNTQRDDRHLTKFMDAHTSQLLVVHLCLFLFDCT
jgi:hypothetical protein